MSADAYMAAQRAQREAADPRQSVFVVANAGSGKTKVLVDRIARLLLRGARPSAFLCITFTKAAAAEMQRRLIRRLGDWCVADDAKLAGQLVELGEPEPDAAQLAVARALFARALETPGGLRIQTIHGFCERLIARFPLEADVPPGFEIAEEARSAALIALAWARVVENADEATTRALERMGAALHQDAFDLLLATLAARRETFARCVERYGGVEAAREGVIARHGETETAQTIEKALIDGLDWSLLADMRAALLQGGKSSDAETAARMAEACAARTLDAVAGVFLKDDGAPYKSLCTKAVSKANPALVAGCERIQDAVVSAIARINAANRAADAVAALTLGHALADAYARAKEEAGALDFEDLILRAHALLAASESAPWVLYKLDGALSHILVDEGQDTSPAQWRLIEPLQAEFFAGEGAGDDERTVFAVGDPKQSIFSFQGADPAQFLNESQTLAKRAEAAGKPFAGPTLLMSFRSTPEVLRAVDATFTNVDIADGPFGSDVIAHTARRDSDVGRVEWWPLAPKPQRVEPKPWDAPQDSDKEATSVAVLCRELAMRTKAWIDAGETVWDPDDGEQRPMRAGDVLVLVRQRGPLFTQALKAMKRVGLPVAGPDRMTLGAEISVQDLLAAARVALDPTDDLSLATLLKSPWIGLISDDDDIFPLLDGRDRKPVIACLRETADPKYAPARAFVEQLIAHAGDHPHAFFARILESADADGVSGWTRMLERIGVAARDPVEELLSRALAIGRSGPATLHHFVQAIENDAIQIKRETEQGADAVRVMTVHGAKGLEAPVVLLADTVAAPKDRPDGNLYFPESGPVMRGGKGTDDAVVAAARDDAERAALHEHRRLLYVAMTRARDRLIVCGAAQGQGKGGADKDSWWCAVREGMTRAGAAPCETPFGEGLALGAVTTSPRAEAISVAAVPTPDWVRRAAPVEGVIAPPVAPSQLAQGPVLSPRGDGRARFRRGALIHGLLQRLPDVPVARREAAAAAWLNARGVSDELARAYAAEALRVLDDARFAPVFGSGSRAEAPIVATLADGATVRGAIDRMVVTADGVLALDYKTDRPPPRTPEETPARILAQMAAYRAALALIFPGKPVRSAILWTDGPALMPLPDALLDAVRPADARC
jgi:ATP-dependent helicase/nuclease subunit A